jgi:hypothetical protein
LTEVLTDRSPLRVTVKLSWPGLPVSPSTALPTVADRARSTSSLRMVPAAVEAPASTVLPVPGL